jgi:hypothetical protein
MWLLIDHEEHDLFNATVISASEIGFVRSSVAAELYVAVSQQLQQRKQSQTRSAS